jgi:hypothetical protein
MDEGWHPVQILAGHGGCEPVGHGTFTLYERGFKGGSVDDAEPVGLGVTLAKYAWYERCFIA